MGYEYDISMDKNKTLNHHYLVKYLSFGEQATSIEF